MRYLRTNTAIRLTVGPFLDKADGVTPETSLTVTSCKLTFMVDDANVPTLVLDTAPTASGGANDMVHVTGDDAGFYDLELAAANVNYLGRAMLAITDAATHCPVFHEFMILPAMIYDAMVLGTDRLDTNVTHHADQAVSLNANNLLKVSLNDILATALTETSGQLAGGFKKWFNVASPTGTVNSVPDALPGAAGGVFIAGSNAATTAATWTVTGATTLTGNVALADGLTIAAPSTANRSGLSITGNGSGHGMLLTSGLTGTGLRVTGATGANITGTGANGLLISGTGTGVGMRVTGGATAAGVEFVGGATSGDALSLAMTSGVGLRADSITVTNVLTVSGATTLTGAVTASNASNNIVGIDVAKLGGGAQSLTDLKDFADTGYDPSTHKVQGVVLVDTTTTNTDMRGTNGAYTGTPPTAAAISTQVASDLLAAHGSGSWQTATGFAVAGDAMTLTAAYDAAKTAATQASVDAVPTVTEIWETALTEAYRATGATGTGAQLLYELLGNLINFANAGTRRTVTKLDKATTAKEYDYDDGSNPTACEEFS